MAISGSTPGINNFYPAQPGVQRMPSATAGRPIGPGLPVPTFQPPASPVPFQTSLMGTTAMTPPVVPQWPVPQQPMPWQVPMMPYAPQGMTWMPVIRTVPQTQTTTEAEKPAEKAAEAETAVEKPVKPAAKTTVEDALAEETGEATPKKITKALAEPEKPLTPAQKTGQKVGEFVTQLLEENPQLQERIDNLNLNAMMANPESFANRFRESFQRSRLFRMTKWLDRRFVSMFPREMEPTVEEVLKWLRTPATGNTGRAGRSRISNASSLLDEPMAESKSPFSSVLGRGKGHAHVKADSKASIEELLGSLDAAPA